MRAAAVGLVLLTCSLAWADLPRLHARIGRTWMFLAPVEGDISVAYTDGLGTRDVEGALLDLGVSVEPALRWRRGRLLLRAPLSVDHRETVGFALREIRLGGGLVVSGRPAPWLTVEGRGGLTWTRRPDWADPYQPLLGPCGDPTGDLTPTDRYSWVSWRVAGELDFDLGDDVALRTRGGFDRRTYTQDPAFDPILAPTHLVPGDRDRGWAGIGVRGQATPVRWRFDATVEVLDSAWELARDAGTGHANALPGGAPPNPLLREVRAAVEHRTSVWLAPLRTRLAATVGYAWNDDVHEGYRSWHQVEAGLDVRTRPWGPLAVEVSWGSRLRWYTDSGYQPGPGHPPLDDHGSGVRHADRNTLRAEASAALADGLVEPFVAMTWQTARTDFPDYAPWTFPAAAAYDIDFDWSRVTATAGVRLSL